MDTQSIVKAGKEIVVKHTVDVLKKRAPFFGLMFEGYEAYKKSTEERAFKNFVSKINIKVEKLNLQFDNEWIMSTEGQNFCSKVMAAAMNSEYCDKQELFANALLNGSIVSDIKAPEKFKFIDILRNLSRPALDVLAFIYTMKDKIQGQTPSMLAENIINTSIKEDKLTGMDFYLVYSCIEEIKSAGLFSTAVKVDKDVDGSYRVRSFYDHTESYTSYTQKFIEFVTQKD